MRVLIACEFSGIVRDAFKAKGHDAWSCDLLPTERRAVEKTYAPNWTHGYKDIIDLMNEALSKE